MDVSCNRCGTDYEFEDALVSTRGTTVKCTSCGHLFKIYKGGAPDQAPADDSRPWLVRRRNGDVEPLVSLGDLTRMIARNEITPEDELSRTGQAWKKLGEIAELNSFFTNPARAQAAIGATPALGLESPSTRPGPRHSDRPLPTGVGSVPPVSRTEVTQPGIDSAAPSIGVSDAAPSAPTPTTPRPSGRPRPRATKSSPRNELPHRPALTVDEPPAAQEHTPRERPSARQRARARGAQTDSMPPPAPGPGNVGPGSSGARSHSMPPVRPAAPRASLPPVPSSTPTPIDTGSFTPIDTGSFAPVASSRGFPWTRVIGLIVLVGIGMGAYAWGTKLLVHDEPTTDPAAVFVTRGDEVLAMHDLRRFTDAVTEYTKALAFNESNVAVLTKLSRTHAVWADALDNLALWDAVRAPEARVERKRQAASAKRHAEAALRLAPDNGEAEIAVVDALRLDGAINAAKEQLARVPEATRSTAESLRVAALLAESESDGDLTQATVLAMRAVEADPQLIRNGILLARLLLTRGDLQAARRQVQTILMRNPSHRMAAMLLSVIEAKAVAPATSAAGPGGTTTGAPDDGTGKTKGESNDASDDPDPGSGAQTASRSNLPPTFEDLIRRGDTMLERGAPRLAKEAFDKALAMRPGAAPALTGLGYVALERNDAAGAVRLFTPAANGGYGDALIGLGDAYRELGRQTEALRAYESYLNRHPGGPRASIARRQVERLRERLGSTRPGSTTTPGFPPRSEVGE